MVNRMKFNERFDGEARRTEDNLIYFLLRNDIVVYVGMTTMGLTRPFSHLDKDYDTVTYQEHGLLSDEELLSLERHYIIKYKPIYNKNILSLQFTSALSVRDLVRKKKNDNNYNLRDLRKDLSVNGYKVFKIGKRNYVETEIVEEFISGIGGD